MSRSRIITLALLLAHPAVGLAQRAAEIDDFLKPIVTRIAADPNVGAWEWRANRNGGYLLRMMMDVTGDGKQEIFVASTLESSRWGHDWRVFNVSLDGMVRPYDTKVYFRNVTPLIENDRLSLVSFAGANRAREQAGDDKYLSVIRFVFSFPEIQDSLFYVDEEEARKFQTTDPSQLPKLQAILLADYLTNPEPGWADVTDLGQDSSNDCYYLEEDRERAEKNTAFTPQVALLRLGIDPSTMQDADNQPGTRQGQTDVQSTAMKKAAATKTSPSAKDEEDISTTTWLIVAIMLAAASALAWLLLRNRW